MSTTKGACVEPELGRRGYTCAARPAPAHKSKGNGGRRPRVRMCFLCPPDMTGRRPDGARIVRGRAERSGANGRCASHVPMLILALVCVGQGVHTTAPSALSQGRLIRTSTRGRSHQDHAHDNESHPTNTTAPTAPIPRVYTTHADDALRPHRRSRHHAPCI